MTVSLRSLADFRRFLATPGATLQRDHDGAPRLIAAVHSTFFLIDPVLPARLDFDKASSWRFNGSRAEKLDRDGQVSISYECRLTQPDPVEREGVSYTVIVPWKGGEAVLCRQNYAPTPEDAERHLEASWSRTYPGARIVINEPARVAIPGPQSGEGAAHA